MTWRQQVDGHYWFPVYTKGEGILHFAGGSGYLAQDVHIRDTIKYSDYKQFGSTTKIIYDGQDISRRTSSPIRNRNSDIRALEAQRKTAEAAVHLLELRHFEHQRVESVRAKFGGEFWKARGHQNVIVHAHAVGGVALFL
jgi:hypothetical protein